MLWRIANQVHTNTNKPTHETGKPIEKKKLKKMVQKTNKKYIVRHSVALKLNSKNHYKGVFIAVFELTTG